MVTRGRGRTSASLLLLRLQSEQEAPFLFCLADSRWLPYHNKAAALLAARLLPRLHVVPARVDFFLSPSFQDFQHVATKSNGSRRRRLDSSGRICRGAALNFSQRVQWKCQAFWGSALTAASQDSASLAAFTLRLSLREPAVRGRGLSPPSSTRGGKSMPTSRTINIYHLSCSLATWF